MIRWPSADCSRAAPPSRSTIARGRTSARPLKTRSGVIACWTRSRLPRRPVSVKRSVDLQACGAFFRVAESAIVNLMVQYQPTVDRAFAALADPTRRAVLERLGTGSATISELAEPFGMSLTGMKKHIRLLEEAELVTTEKIGRVRRCMLVPYAFEGISTWLQRLDRLAQVVERTKGAR